MPGAAEKQPRFKAVRGSGPIMKAVETSRRWLAHRPVIRRLLVRLAGFGVVSLVGWALDFAIFATLVLVGLSPFFSNLVGATVGVTFVYFVSARKIFVYQGQFLYWKFAVYLAYQACAITLASWAIGALTLHTPLPAIASKTVVTPLTFGANFLFMSFLMRDKWQIAKTGSNR